MKTQYFEDKHGNFYRTNPRRRTYDFHGRNDNRWWNRADSKGVYSEKIMGLSEISYDDFVLEMI